MFGINGNFNTNGAQRTNSAENTTGKIKLTDDEKLDRLIDGVQKYIAENGERQIPENGKFSTRVGLFFDIPGTENEAVLSVFHDEVDPKTQRRFSVGVRRRNTDKITSEFLAKGTKKEILDYVKNKENYPAIKKTVLELSKHVDENH